MSEQLLPGLPPLPPARPMTEGDWTRLEARIDAAIETHERTRRRRLVLAMAAALLVLLVAAAATWWHSTRPTPGSSAMVSIACASDATPNPAHMSVVDHDGTDPRSQCETEWRTGALDGTKGGAPPSPLVACARTVDGNVLAFVFPTAGPDTCGSLGYEDLPPAYEDESRVFAALYDRIGTYTPEDGGACVAYGAVRDTTAKALADLGLDDWEVAPDRGSIQGEGTCVWYWVADHEQRLVFVYGWTGPSR